MHYMSRMRFSKFWWVPVCGIIGLAMLPTAEFFRGVLILVGVQRPMPLAFGSAACGVGVIVLCAYLAWGMLCERETYVRGERIAAALVRPNAELDARRLTATQQERLLTELLTELHAARSSGEVVARSIAKLEASTTRPLAKANEPVVHDGKRQGLSAS